MKTIAPKTLSSIADTVWRIPVLKNVFSVFFKMYAKMVEKENNKLFQKNGIKVLKDFDTLMMNNNIQYSVFAGTLLGAIREGGFLSHDLDIDVVVFCDMFPSNARQLLEENGFKFLHMFLVEDGKIGREETYIKDGVSIDIFFIYSDDDFATYQCDFYPENGAFSHRNSMNRFGYVRVRRLEFPVSRKVIRHPFSSIEVNVLANAKEWLTYRYGKDYMIPQPDFRDKGDNPHICNWDKYKAVMIDEKD